MTFTNPINHCICKKVGLKGEIKVNAAIVKSQFIREKSAVFIEF